MSLKRIYMYVYILIYMNTYIAESLCLQLKLTQCRLYFKFKRKKEKKNSIGSNDV